jgi:hypothetical protein
MKDPTTRIARIAVYLPTGKERGRERENSQAVETKRLFDTTSFNSNIIEHTFLRLCLGYEPKKKRWKKKNVRT